MISLYIELFLLLLLTEEVTSYSPNAEVQAGHNIPHLDANLGPADVEFSVSGAYITSVIVFPVIILIITVTISVLFLGALLLRCCLRTCGYCCGIKCNCCENIDLTEKIRRRTIVERILWFFVFSAVSIDCFLFYGSAIVTTAFLDIAHAISKIVDWLNSLVSSTQDILYHVQLTTLLATSSPCSGFRSAFILENIKYIQSASVSLRNFADSILTPFLDLENSIRTTAVGKKDLVWFHHFVSID